MTDLQSFNDIAVVLGQLCSCVDPCLSDRDPQSRVLLNNLYLGEQCCQLCLEISWNSNTPCLCCNATAVKFLTVVTKDIFISLMPIRL